MRKVARQVAEGRKRKTVIDPKKLATCSARSASNTASSEAEIRPVPRSAWS